MRPSDCGKCRDWFLGQLALQAELSHLAATVGAGTAEAELNERLADLHAEHEYEAEEMV